MSREWETVETTANVLGRHAGLPLRADAEREWFQPYEMWLKPRVSEGRWFANMQNYLQLRFKIKMYQYNLKFGHIDTFFVGISSVKS